MDELIKTHENDDNKAEFYTAIRDLITQAYKEKTGQDLTLTDEQIQTIVDTHRLRGELGKLTQAELTAKTRKLTKTITDPAIRMFLLEGGFCGQMGEDLKMRYYKNISSAGKKLFTLK